MHFQLTVLSLTDGVVTEIVSSGFSVQVGPLKVFVSKSVSCPFLLSANDCSVSH